jgi:hypothetical protein
MELNWKNSILLSGGIILGFIVLQLIAVFVLFYLILGQSFPVFG